MRLVSPSMSPEAARRATSSRNPSSSASSSKPSLVRMVLMSVMLLVMYVSPLRAPGAASGRVVSAVSVTTCFHYLHLDGDCKPPRSLFLRPRSIFPEAEQLGEIPGQGVVGARRRAQRLDPVSYAVVARHDLPD